MTEISDTRKDELNEVAISVMDLVGKLTLTFVFALFLALVFDFLNPCGFTLLEVFKCQK